MQAYLGIEFQCIVRQKLLAQLNEAAVATRYYQLAVLLLVEDIELGTVEHKQEVQPGLLNHLQNLLLLAAVDHHFDAASKLFKKELPAGYHLLLDAVLPSMGGLLCLCRS
jgi:hypothetical protein